MLVLKSKHTILCGDSLSTDLELAIGQDKVGLVVADPPYGCNERTDRLTRDRGKLTKGKDFKPVLGDDSNETAIAAFAKLRTVAKDQVWFGANFYPMPPSPSWIVWDKRGEVAPDDNGDCELAWSNLGGPIRQFTHLWKGCIKASEHGEPKIHGTQKPVALYEWIFARSRADVILDPFLGSGASLIAADKMSKKMIGIEIDPDHVDLVLARYNKPYIKI